MAEFKSSAIDCGVIEAVQTQAFDVVVIGGGTAGLEAACTAAEVGCNTFLLEKGISRENMLNAFKEAETLRKEGCQVSMNMMKKNKKFQKDQLMAEGYEEIREFFNKV